MNRLRELREDGNFIQTDIAKTLGIAKNTYCEIENDKYELSMNSLKILSKFYKTSVDYLLYRTDNREAYPKSIIKTIGKMNRLKELRTKIKKTQKEFAEDVSIPINTYKNYEQMLSGLNYDLLNKLANYYNTSIDYIIYNTDNIKPYPKSKVDLK